MLTGPWSHLWPGRVRLYCRRLNKDLLGRYPHRTRAGDLRLRQWSSGPPWRPIAQRRKGVSGLRRWSLVVMVVGQQGRVEVVEQAKEVMRYLLCMVARQSEVHTSQKVRRALQLYSAHSRLWGEEAARNMLARLRQALASKGQHLLLSAVCFSTFNWEQEKISNDRLQESAKDLDSVVDLCRATVECHTCGKRQVIDQKMVNVDYCLCGGTLGYTSDTREYESWKPFIEREHHIVWRRKHPIHDHLFAYKVYGSYDDVSLGSFMETQLNSDYRTEWDDTALQLRVLQSHQDSNSDLVYWLVKFPHFFANRDYVFKRRFMVNSERREVVIMSEAVSPEVVPEEKGIHRVNEYWSTMVIRARGDVDQPGIEYTLTYFDNPGTSLPQSITNFIAVTGFPNFLKKLHLAALHLQSSHEKGDDVYVSLPTMLRFPHQWRKDLHKLPELEVPSDEVQVFVEDSEDVEIEEANIEALSGAKLSGEDQDENSKVISLSITSALVEDSGGETPNDEETHTQEEPSNTNIPLEDNETGSHGGNSSEIVEKNVSLAADPLKENISDKSLHVNIGGRKISIDLLEAMEVVAPELEKKSLLLRKMEELNNMLNDNEKQNAILQKLRKLRHKLKSFQEEAMKRRERSMRHMEQLTNRDHYHHMSIDEKTLTQLELLFEAMKYVLEADRDMRTGKILLEKSHASRSEAEMEDGSLKRAQSADSPGLSPMPVCARKDGDDSPPDGEKQVNSADSKAKTSKKTKNKNRGNQDRQPPKEPPPPDSAGGDWQEGETSRDADDRSSEGGNFSNDLGNITKNVHNLDNEVNETRSWFGVPNISAWWEAGSRQGSVPSEYHPDTLRQENNAVSDLDAQTNTLLAQIYYVVALRWIFNSEGEKAPSLIQQKNVKSTYGQQEDSEVGEEEDCTNKEVRWYWYPFSGAYRVYAWVFSASGVNA